MTHLLRSPSQLVNPLARQRFMGYGTAPGGASFVGALDAYTTNLVALYSPFKRLLTSYTGNGIRVRRSSDSTLQWIGFNADGSFDETSYLAFIGAGNGFAHTVADQSGAGRNVSQSTTAAQPQIAKDANGDYYLYAPGAGFTTTSMPVTGLSIACTDFTLWTVSSSSGYAFVPIMTRDDSLLKERQILNYGSSLVALIQDNAVGTESSIGSTNTNVYSVILAAGSGGNKISNRLTTNTGTRVVNSCTINRIGIGYNAGGPFWSQNSRFYIGAVWSEDKGPGADFAALATLGRTLIPAAQ